MARQPAEPKARKLKVFRTAIGFHDAFVAAPSRKAALAAWGSTADLFARGVAEEVDDPALTAAPLATPGEVVRLPRGTTDEYFAALPPSPVKGSARRSRKEPTSPAPRRPPPSRDKLDAAEAALAAAEERFRGEAAALHDRERALADERRALDRRRSAEVAALETRRDEARTTYRAAVADQD